MSDVLVIIASVGWIAACGLFIWREVEALSESVRDGYVSAPDLIRVLRDEYEIDIIGG